MTPDFSKETLLKFEEIRKDLLTEGFSDGQATILAYYFAQPLRESRKE